MLVRAYEEKDLEDLRRIHAAQGFPYAFPDLANPLFLTKLVLVSDEAGGIAGREEAAKEQSCRDGGSAFSGCSAPTGRIVGAALLRLTAEAYLLLDPSAATPRQRWEWLLGLQGVTER